MKQLFFKRFFATILMLAVCSLSWAFDFESNGIYYLINTDGTSVSVTNRGLSGSYSSSVVIPSTVQYSGKQYSVTNIGASAFSGCADLTSVNIPNSVTNIGDGAFSGCTGLASITIPNSVARIEATAFSGCSGLTSIMLNSNAIVGHLYTGGNGLKKIFGPQVEEYIIGDNVPRIGEQAFSGCSNLTSVTIGNSVTSIDNYAFSSCSGLTSVTIPNSVTRIAHYAFYNCTGLTSVTIGNSVTSIGGLAFSHCTGLTSVTIPNSVTSIGGEAFSGCSGMKSVTIGNSVTSIGNHAFRNCTGLTSVIIPDGVEEIGINAFENCTGLTSVTIPNSVTSIDYYAFSGCSGLTSVTIPNSVTSIGASAFSGCSGLTSVTIPNSVTSIGGEAFSGCSALTSVTLNSNDIVSKTYTTDSNIGTIFGTQVKEYILGDDVTSIGSNAFENCTGLISVTIGNSVSSIGNLAFSGCSALRSITLNSNDIVSKTYTADSNLGTIFSNHLQQIYIIGDDVTSIGGRAFSRCSNLTSVTIGNSVTSIGGEAFSGCSRLTSVTLNSNDIVSKTYTASSNIGTIFGTQVKVYILGDDVTSIGSNAFENCTGLTSVTIGKSVTGIASSSFSGCTGLTSVTIGKSVTSIGASAFSGCTGLTSVTIPSSVTSISTSAFSGCTGLTSVTIGKSVTSIGASAFSGCTGLTSVTIPSSVTSISTSAFYGCSNLRSIVVDEENVFYNSRKGCNAIIETSTNTLIVGCRDTLIPYGVTSIGSNAFSGCSGLTSVTIPNSVSSIGNNAFYACSGLTSVTMPNSVTSIGNSAFYNCTKLASVILPVGMASIGSSAFYGCTDLKSVTCRALSVPNTGQNCFKNVPKDTLYVSGSVLKAYKAASQWMEFSNVLPLAYDFISDGIYYSINSDCTSVTVTSVDPSELNNSGSLVIPTSVQYFGKQYNVTSIGSNAFNGCADFTSFIIPNSVTSIGDFAFSGCTGLASITIPNKLSSIGNGTFSGCVGLTSITIPKSVTSIGERAFYGCTGIASITIPNSVTSIGIRAFSGCIGLTSMVVDGTNPYYDSRNNCNAIIETSSNTLIAGCQNTVMPNSITVIGGYSFSDFTGLTSIAIPESVTSIGEYAFSGCTGLMSVTCRALSVPNTGVGCFAKVPLGTATLYVPRLALESYRTAPRWVDFSNILEMSYDVKQAGIYYRINSDGISVTVTNGDSSGSYSGSVVIPSSITYVGNQYSVTSIGANAFSCCPDLISVTIPNSVTNIGTRAFSDCPDLISVTIPSSVISIADEAFFGCTGLISITIPNSVTSIGSRAFNGCVALTSMVVDEANPYFDSRSNCNAIIETSYNSLVAGCKNTVIPNSVTSIGSNAFRNCTGLTSIIIPHNVTDIAANAFSGCTGLTSVICHSLNVPNTGENCFENVPLGTATLYVFESALESYEAAPQWMDFSNVLPLAFDFMSDGIYYLINTDGTSVSVTNRGLSGSYSSSVVIPSTVQYSGKQYSVTNIGASAFSGCADLTSVNIPNSVTNIGDGAFSGCTGLASITIPNSVARIEATAFSGCSGLTSIMLNSNAIVSNSYTLNSNFRTIFGIQVMEYTLGDDITGIGDYAFANCANISSIVIPNSVTSIGNYAFQNCSNISSVTIPSSVISIGAYVFSGCTSLNSIVVDEANPYYDSRNDCNAIINTSYNSLIAGCRNTVIPNSVTSIGSSAFRNCTGLTSITIPNSVLIIGNYAFSGCTGLKEVYCMAEQVPNTGSDVFDNSIISSAILYVPASSHNAYASTAPWRNFGTIASSAENVHYSQTPVQSVGELVNTQVYTAETQRAAWYVPAGSTQMESTGYPTVVQKSSTSTGQQFAFIQHEGQYYIYCVGEGKILNGITSNDPNRGVLVTEDCQPVTIKETGDTDYPLFFSFGTHNINIGGHKEISIDYWSTMDAGNKVALRPVQGVTLSDSEISRIIRYIEGSIPGDVNGDGDVNGADIVAVINYVLNDSKTDGDVNGDGEVNGADIVAVINYVLSYTGDEARQQTYYAHRAPVSPTDTCNRLSANTDADGITLGLTNETDFTAFQFVLQLPDGCELTNVDADASRLCDHVLQYRRMPDGRYFVLGYNMDNESIAGQDGTLLHLQLAGNISEGASVTDVLFFTPEAETHRLAGIHVDLVTGLTSLENATEDTGNIYDVHGRIVMKAGQYAKHKNHLPTDIYIRNGRKFIVK